MTDVSGCRRGAAMTLSGLVAVAGVMLVGAPVAWGEPGADAVSAINDRYAAFGGEGSLLGAPAGDAVDVPGGAERPYAGGAIYYSKDTGAHVMYGAILERYQALGGPAGSGLGFPKNDEDDTGDGTGRFNDFSDPEGASIYWTPQWGASVIKGRVLEAWRQSGAVTGPFGYPSTDTSVVDGVQTGKFVGPEGTEIQWSQTDGLVTIPAALAERIPGFSSGSPTAGATPSAEGTTPVTKPTLSGPQAPASTKSSKWWWIPVGIAGLALLAGLGRLLRRKPEPEPVRVAPARVAEVKTPTPPPPPRPAPPVAPRPAPTPPKVVPLAKTPPPPPPARPAPVPPPPPPAPAPRTVVHTETDHDVAPVIRYESQTPPETTIRVTYENNAIGDDQKSVADKSDSVPDSQQL